MKSKSSLLAVLACFFWVTNSSAQKPYDRTDMLKVIDSNLHKAYKSSYPITRDTLNQYPDSMVIEGTMVDYITGVSCGYYCGCGAIKIKLTSLHPIYKETFVYVVMPCFNQLPASFEKRQRWKLYKIPLNDKSCYWTEVPINKFDSKGVPFYTMKE